MEKLIIKFKPHDQDNLNFYPIISLEQARELTGDNFDEIYSNSQGEHFKFGAEISCYCDGSDHIQPYFTMNDAREEFESYIDEFDTWCDLEKVEYDGKQTVVNFY